MTDDPFCNLFHSTSSFARILHAVFVCSESFLLQKHIVEYVIIRLESCTFRLRTTSFPFPSLLTPLSSHC